MIQYTLRNLLALTLLIGFASCEDFFNKKPYDGTETEDILTDARDAQIILNGMYSGFMDGASYGTYLTSTLDVSTDAAYAAYGFSNTWGDVYAWRLHPGSGEVGAIWGTAYSTVYNANFLLNNLHTIDIDEDVENQIMAECYTGRALIYHNLVRIYGKAYSSSTSASDLGIPYVMTYDNDEPMRNTVAEVYDFLIADITKAIELFEDNSETDNVYFTKDFANGLLARVYLDMQEYELAKEAATLVIDGSYRLANHSEFTNMWLNDTGSEIIWKVKYDAEVGGAAPGYYFYNRNNPYDAPLPDYIPANNWVNSYDEDDIRATAYFNTATTGYGWRGELIYKYPTNPLWTFQGTNMPKPMRIAEMYLIRAEANSYLDKREESIQDLETLLDARITGFDEISDNVQLNTFIAQERKKELLFEGFYFFDLKRRGEGFQRTPQAETGGFNDLKIDAGDYRWQWPIPRAELNGNPNIQQNPGY